MLYEVITGDFPELDEFRRSRQADDGHGPVRHRAGLGQRESRRAGRRQAFHWRRRRQGEPDPGADPGRLRRLRADDLRRNNFV